MLDIWQAFATTYCLRSSDNATVEIPGAANEVELAGMVPGCELSTYAPTGENTQALPFHWQERAIVPDPEAQSDIAPPSGILTIVPTTGTTGSVAAAEVEVLIGV